MPHHDNPLGPEWILPIPPPHKRHPRRTWLVILALTVATFVGIGCAAVWVMNSSFQHRSDVSVPTTTPDTIQFADLPGGHPGHSGRGQVNEIAYAPDNQTLAVASGIGVWLYRLNPLDHGRLLPTTAWVKSVDWSPDGRRLVGGTSGKVIIWSVSDGHILQTIELPEDMALYSRVEWSPDGAFIAANVLLIGRTETRIWAPTTGQLVHLLSHTGANGSVSWSPDSRQVAIAVGNDLQIWIVATEHLRSTLHGRASSLDQVAWSPDGSKIATGSLDEVRALNETVHVWAASDGRLLTTIHAHVGYVTDLAWSPDGSHIVTSGFNDTIARIWSVTDGHLVTILVGHLHDVDSVSWSPDGTQIATSSSFDSEVRIWSARDGHLMQRLSEHMPL